MSWLYGRPTAAELVAAVADFLDNDVRSSTEGRVNFHARVAANVLRIVERELTDDSAEAVTGRLADLGFADGTPAGGSHPRRNGGRPRGRCAADAARAGPPSGWP